MRWILIEVSGYKYNWMNEKWVFATDDGFLVVKSVRILVVEEAEKLIAEMPIPQDSTGMMIWNYQRYLIRSKDSKEHDVQDAERHLMWTSSEFSD